MQAIGPICLLILAHKVSSLDLLLKLLDGRFRVFVHMDAKVAGDRLQLPPSSYVQFVSDRLPIYWGGYNMVRATRSLIDLAVSSVPDASRFVLLSGDALPTVTLEDLETYFSDRTIEFIDLMPVENDMELRNTTHQQALARHRWLQPWKFQNYVYWDNPLTNPRTENMIVDQYGLSASEANKLRIASHLMVQDIFLRFGHRQNLFQQLYYGCQWWALSRRAIELIRHDMHHPSVDRFFEFMDVPDEHFFQCLLGRHLETLRSHAHSIRGTFMYTDHNDPIRASFGDDALASSRFSTLHAQTGRVFARKFDPVRSPDIASSILRGRYFQSLSATADAAGTTPR